MIRTGQPQLARESKGASRRRYAVRLSNSAQGIVRAQALRSRAFGIGGRDSDDLDEKCLHLLIEDRLTGDLAGCCRVLPIRNGDDLAGCYASQSYDLGRLTGFHGPMLELGRLCTRSGSTDPDVLRIALGALTGLVDRSGIRMVFGCSSFAGTDPAPYRAAFALLRDHHLGPERWRPRIRASEVVSFPSDSSGARSAKCALPPLLRLYLNMGGWVGNHAVIDRNMNTLHVFTALQMAAVPPVRARQLRMLASEIEYLQQDEGAVDVLTHRG